MLSTFTQTTLSLVVAALQQYPFGAVPAAYSGGGGGTPPTMQVSVSNTTLQANAKRAGVNMAGILPYDAKQTYKNLIAYDPGFVDTSYRSVISCGSGTNTNLCVAANSILNMPTGFWPSGSVVVAQTGALAGCQTTVTSWTQPDLYLSGTWTAHPDYPAASGCSSHSLVTGDYVYVSKTVSPGSTGYSPFPLGATFQTSTFGSPVATTETTDLPTSTAYHTFKEALNVSCPTVNDYYYLEYFFDNSTDAVTGSNFLNLNASYTFSYRAKATSGTAPSINYQLKRTSGTTFLNGADSITTSWATYSHTFTATETGVNASSLEALWIFNSAQNVEFTDMRLEETSTIGNTTPFRDAVVTTLVNMKAGSIRFWDESTATDTILNRLSDQTGRAPVNFGTGNSGNGGGTVAGYNNGIEPSYPDALQLCLTVGADCYLILPVTVTPAEATLLTDYLGDSTSGTTGGALRINQGFSSSWVSQFAAAGLHIYFEMGNEVWNGGFEGETYETNLALYGQIAQRAFSTMKADTRFNSSVIKLVAGSQFGNPSIIQTVGNQISSADYMAVAPYTDNQPTDASNPNLWTGFFAEPQVYWQVGTASGSGVVCAEYVSGVLCPSQTYVNVSGTPANVYGGGMYLNKIAAANATTPMGLVVYEENNSTDQGNFSQANEDIVTSSLAMGVEQGEQILTNMANGVMTQNLFTLAQSQFNISLSGGATHARLWGIVEDMGVGFRLRPQYLAAQLINNAIGNTSTMLTTTQSGTPTFSVGNPATSTTINTVATSSAQTILSYAFYNGSNNYSVILFNLDQSNPQTVGIVGTNGPSNGAALTIKTLGGANALSDLNETSTTVSIASSTASYSTSAGVTIPAHSIVSVSYTH